MNAFLFIRSKRRIAERIELAGTIRAASLKPEDYRRTVDSWAKVAEINMRWED